MEKDTGEAKASIFFVLIAFALVFFFLYMALSKNSHQLSTL